MKPILEGLGMTIGVIKKGVRPSLCRLCGTYTRMSAMTIGVIGVPGEEKDVVNKFII